MSNLTPANMSGEETATSPLALVFDTPTVTDGSNIVPRAAIMPLAVDAGETVIQAKVQRDIATDANLSGAINESKPRQFLGVVDDEVAPTIFKDLILVSPSGGVGFSLLADVQGGIQANVSAIQTNADDIADIDLTPYAEKAGANTFTGVNTFVGDTIINPKSTGAVSPLALLGESDNAVYNSAFTVDKVVRNDIDNLYTAHTSQTIYALGVVNSNEINFDMTAPNIISFGYRQKNDNSTKYIQGYSFFDGTRDFVNGILPNKVPLYASTYHADGMTSDAGTPLSVNSSGEFVKDVTIVQTTNDQTISGDKTFSGLTAFTGAVDTGVDAVLLAGLDVATNTLLKSNVTIGDVRDGVAALEATVVNALAITSLGDEKISEVLSDATLTGNGKDTALGIDTANSISWAATQSFNKIRVLTPFGDPTGTSNALTTFDEDGELSKVLLPDGTSVTPRTLMEATKSELLAEDNNFSGGNAFTGAPDTDLTSVNIALLDTDSNTLYKSTHTLDDLTLVKRDVVLDYDTLRTAGTYVNAPDPQMIANSPAGWSSTADAGVLVVLATEGVWDGGLGQILVSTDYDAGQTNNQIYYRCGQVDAGFEQWSKLLMVPDTGASTGSGSCSSANLDASGEIVSFPSWTSGDLTFQRVGNVVSVVGRFTSFNGGFTVAGLPDYLRASTQGVGSAIYNNDLATVGVVRITAQPNAIFLEHFVDLGVVGDTVVDMVGSYVSKL